LIQHAEIRKNDNDLPQFLSSVGDRIVFRALTAKGQFKLFSVGKKGKDLIQHTDLCSGRTDNPRHLITIGNSCFFTANSPDKNGVISKSKLFALNL
jgi:hypothetical protein